MTSGTPESDQNWVLSGFQNCLDRASISALDGKAISSSAMSPPGSGRSPVYFGLTKYVPFRPLPVKRSKLSPYFMNHNSCHDSYLLILSAL